MMARSIRSPLMACNGAGRRLGGGDLELVVKAELLDERVAQVLIVVHDEEAAGIRHLRPFMRTTRATGSRSCARTDRVVVPGLTTRGWGGPSTAHDTILRRPHPRLSLRRSTSRRGRLQAGNWSSPVRSGARASPRQARGRRRLAHRPLRPAAGLLPGRPRSAAAHRPAPRAASGRRTAGATIRATAATTGSIPLPSPTSHERMWRDDHLYDVVVDIGWNRGPIVRGRGSAIFLHLARPGFTPTEGCVAVDKRVIRRLLARIGPKTRIAIIP